VEYKWAMRAHLKINMALKPEQSAGHQVETKFISNA
jgi:hypothetical protein